MSAPRCDLQPTTDVRRPVAATTDNLQPTTSGRPTSDNLQACVGWWEVVSRGAGARGVTAGGVRGAGEGENRPFLGTDCISPQNQRSELPARADWSATLQSSVARVAAANERLQAKGKGALQFGMDANAGAAVYSRSAADATPRQYGSGNQQPSGIRDGRRGSLLQAAIAAADAEPVLCRAAAQPDPRRPRARGGVGAGGANACSCHHAANGRGVFAALHQH